MINDRYGHIIAHISRSIGQLQEPEVKLMTQFDPKKLIIKTQDISPTRTPPIFKTYSSFGFKQYRLSDDCVPNISLYALYDDEHIDLDILDNIVYYDSGNDDTPNYKIGYQVDYTTGILWRLIINGRYSLDEALSERIIDQDEYQDLIAYVEDFFITQDWEVSDESVKSFIDKLVKDIPYDMNEIAEIKNYNYTVAITVTNTKTKVTSSRVFNIDKWYIIELVEFLDYDFDNEYQDLTLDYELNWLDDENSYANEPDIMNWFASLNDCNDDE